MRGLLSDHPDIAIESHLKRLAMPLNEIRPLLDALNVTPMSEAIRMVPELSNANLHSQSDQFGEHLSLLVRKAVALVEREQANAESASRNVNLFLQEWREQSEARFSDIRFFKSNSINVHYEFTATNTTLRQMKWGAFVSADTAEHLSIYISGDLIEVFDTIADQLRAVLRIDLLPVGLRDEIASLLQSNLARLGHEQFGVFLNQRLKERGFPVEDDEELQRILKSATKALEVEVNAAPEGREQEDQSLRSHSNPSSNSGGGNTRANKGQNQQPSNTLTAEEILAELPEFEESSFGSDSVFDLLGTSQWQVQSQKNKVRSSSGASSGGGGNFKNTQAYRDAYGQRGEEWVKELEVRSLIEADKPCLAEQVLHRSKDDTGSPWDIESFEKSNPHKAVYVEVKSTPDADNFEINMSAEQIRAALQSSRPYYLYRVVEVHTAKPKVYVYDFKEIAPRLQFSATNVSVMLPKPEEPEQ